MIIGDNWKYTKITKKDLEITFSELENYLYNKY